MSWESLKLVGQGPFPRCLHTASVVGTKIFVFAGCNDSGKTTNDMHTLNTEGLGGWNVPSCTGVIPKPRCGHTTTLLQKGIMMVFGGAESPNGDEPMNDLALFNVETLAWSRPRVSGTPPQPVTMHTATFVAPDSVLIFGGLTAKGPTSELVSFSIGKRSWTQFSVPGGPCARYGHTSCLIGKQMYVYGGNDGTRKLSDIWALDTTTLKWSLITPASAQPPAVFGHASCVVANKILVSGGESESGFLEEVFHFDPQTRVWSVVVLPRQSEIPAPRLHHTLTDASKKVYMLGGVTNPKSANNGLPYMFLAVKMELSPFSGSTTSSPVSSTTTSTSTSPTPETPIEETPEPTPTPTQTVTARAVSPPTIVARATTPPPDPTPHTVTAETIVETPSIPTTASAAVQAELLKRDTTEITALKQTIENQENQIILLKAQAVVSKDDLMKVQAVLNKTVSSMEEKMQASSQQLEAYHRDIETKTTLVSQLEMQLKESTDQLVNLKAATSLQKQSYESDLQGKLNDLEAQLSSLKSENSSLKQQAALVQSTPTQDSNQEAIQQQYQHQIQQLTQELNTLKESHYTCPQIKRELEELKEIHKTCQLEHTHPAESGTSDNSQVVAELQQCKAEMEALRQKLIACEQHHEQEMVETKQHAETLHQEMQRERESLVQKEQILSRVITEGEAAMSHLKQTLSEKDREVSLLNERLLLSESKQKEIEQAMLAGKQKEGSSEETAELTKKMQQLEAELKDLSDGKESVQSELTEWETKFANGVIVDAADFEAQLREKLAPASAAMSEQALAEAKAAAAAEAKEAAAELIDASEKRAVAALEAKQAALQQLQQVQIQLTDVTKKLAEMEKVANTHEQHASQLAQQVESLKACTTAASSGDTSSGSTEAEQFKQQLEALKADHVLLMEDRDQWRALSEQIESLGAQTIKEHSDQLAEAQQTVAALTAQRDKLEEELGAATTKNEQMDRMLKRLTQVGAKKS
ncbi:rab9 effector protein with kelch motifs [Pelomyxa schiedti]|nr:rab9 effector protein with kelch motifs [Pelomyxa schiedti]